MTHTRITYNPVENVFVFQSNLQVQQAVGQMEIVCSITKNMTNCCKKNRFFSSSFYITGWLPWTGGAPQGCSFSSGKGKSITCMERNIVHGSKPACRQGKLSFNLLRLLLHQLGKCVHRVCPPTVTGRKILAKQALPYQKAKEDWCRVLKINTALVSRDLMLVRYI